MVEPTQITISGASAGYNALLSVSGYGSFVVRVERIQYALQVLSSEARSAQHKVYYPHMVLEPDFGLVMIFATWAQREAFSSWVSTYMKKVTTRQIRQGSMTVSVPARRFVRNAVPHGTLEYGDDVAQSGRAYRVTISFTGATNPIRGASSFKPSKSKDVALATFYPGGNQVGGAESLAGTLFDETVEPTIGPDRRKIFGEG